MANKDHSLDDKIIKAAYSEFLAYGFCKASLHKISEKAGVTTGAIYTRYKNKDALFVALLQDFFEAMKVMFAPVAKEYEKAMLSAKKVHLRSEKSAEIFLQGDAWCFAAEAAAASPHYCDASTV